jgi:hypothetical protein
MWKDMRFAQCSWVVYLADQSTMRLPNFGRRLTEPVRILEGEWNNTGNMVLDFKISPIANGLSIERFRLNKGTIKIWGIWQHRGCTS